jgi:hypothetical protein
LSVASVTNLGTKRSFDQAAGVRETRRET